MTALVTPVVKVDTVPVRTAARWWSWVPPAVAAAGTAGALVFYGVPLTTTAVFVAYIVGGVLLPGTLLWRWVQGRSGSLVGDAAAGLAVGYAAEVLTYIGARAAGLPRLGPVWAVVTLLAFVAVPQLRKFWRGREQRTPPAWSLAMSGTALVLVWWSCVAFFRTHDLYEPGLRAPDSDSTFHLALIGEARHHMPMVSPWLPEQPLLYHWFVYAEMAATSWATGVEPQTLLLRLSPLPMVLGTLVLIGVLGVRLTGRWWAGVAAALVTWLALTPSVYQWPLDAWFGAFATNAYEDGSLLRVQMWTSPTQTFGALLFAGLALALVELLTAPTARRWVVVVLLVAAVAGGKVTFLPMLLCGLLLVVAVTFVRSRRLHRTAAAAAGVVLVAIAVAQFVLFRGAAQGMSLQPLHFARISGAPYTAGFGDGPLRNLLLITAITVLCWAFVWPGLAALRRLYADPQVLAESVVLMLGVGVAGVVALVTLAHEGGAEGWFMVSGRPYLTLAAVAGIALITPAGIPTRKLVLHSTVAAAAGAVALVVYREQLPTRPGDGWALLWPYIGIVGIAGLLMLAVRGTRLPARRTLCAAVLAGVCAATGIIHLHHWTRDATRTGWRGVIATAVTIPHGTRTAGRWLRDHSDPGDLVATNAHCLAVRGPCDNRHFSFSAYTERRFLVEAWGFTNRAHQSGRAAGIPSVHVPYWDPVKLADNDTAFAEPNRERLGRLAEHYGVRWLFVDESYGGVSPSLGDFADLRFRSGHIAVYRIGAQ